MWPSHNLTLRAISAPHSFRRSKRSSEIHTQNFPQQIQTPILPAKKKNASTFLWIIAKNTTRLAETKKMWAKGRPPQFITTKNNPSGKPKFSWAGGDPSVCLQQTNLGVPPPSTRGAWCGATRLTDDAAGSVSRPIRPLPRRRERSANTEWNASANDPLIRWPRFRSL